MKGLVAGDLTGDLVILDEGLSLWGGFDVASGRVIDESHSQRGVVLSGKVVYMPHARGSSSSSSVLAEAMRIGTAPSGIVLGEPDSILVIGSLVARRLYGVECPIYVGEIGELEGSRLGLGST